MTKLLSSLLLAGAVLSSASSAYNHRPYISTNLAKAIITYNVDDTMNNVMVQVGSLTEMGTRQSVRDVLPVRTRGRSQNSKVLRVVTL